LASWAGTRLQDNATLASRWSAELDKHGVARSILMSSVPDDEASASDAARTSPHRFYGYFMFNPKDADAASRAARAFGDLGMQGMCLFPAMHRYSIQDEALEPVLAEAGRRKNVVVFVHSGVLTVGVRKKLGLASKFDMSRSNPIDLHRVAMDHPNINFVIPHFGAGYFREALMLGDLAPNVYMDTSGTNSWIKYPSARNFIEGCFPKIARDLRTEAAAVRLGFFVLPEGMESNGIRCTSPGTPELDVDADSAEAILGGNLKRLLGN
jgi:predicted TIM-barrel fold metal-dependent hydrolase